MRRELAREQDKLARAREQLAALQAGGNPERPVVVESASQIEPHARSMTCPVCGDHFRVLEHTVQHRPGGSLRLVSVVSPQCGRRRTIYFAIRPHAN